MLSAILKKKNQEESVTVVKEENTSTETKKLIKPSDEDEYIWVEGYKGTPQDMVCVNGYIYYLSDMRCYNQNEQKYELNKEVSLDDKEEPELCKKGFHFCLKLEDVFDYYQYDFSNRYFKVRAYVKKEDYDSVRDSKHTKLAAKKIVLYEEVFPEYEIVKDYLKYAYSLDSYTYVYQMPKELFEDIRNSDLPFTYYMDNYFYTEMIAAGYSSAFTMLLRNKYNDRIAREMYILEKAKALKEEGVSTDMTAYMLLKEE